MTFCFFSLFSDFWSPAILHISSGLKNASWLFKKKKKKKKEKKMQKHPEKNPEIIAWGTSLEPLL